MKKILFLILFFLCVTSAAEARNIRVLLSSAGKYSVSGSENITVTDASKRTHSIGSAAAITVSGKYISIAGKKYPMPVSITSGGLLGFKGYKYRGELRITKDGSLVNVLDVEDYVRGVIGAEANPNWHGEYLKVQAIISRTFGLRESLSASGRDYDVHDSTASQVYRGVSAETPTTDRAVKETAGKVLAHGNELAGTYFHSDSGGATANISDVWGRDVPYLRARKEPVSYTSPNSNWEKRLSPSEVSKAVKKIIPNIGTIKEIMIVNTDLHGRAVDLKIIHSGGASAIKASAFRTAVGPNVIKSTVFTVSGTPAKGREIIPVAPAPAPTPAPQPTKKIPEVIDLKSPMTADEDAQLAEIIKGGGLLGKEMVEILTRPEKRKELLYIALARLNGTPAPAPKKTEPAPTVSLSDLQAIESGKAIPLEGGYFVFRGKGWGHGVGLSQYGGRTLADAGWSAERILTHYFPGTKVKAAR